MKRILLISIALAVLLGVACNDSTGPDPEGITPIERIYLVELSFNDRDISRFEEQLASDFIFWFDADDVGKDIYGYIIPESWDYDHMQRAIMNLLRSEAEGGPYAVFMELLENDIGSPPEGATEYSAGGIGIDLRIYSDEYTVDSYVDSGTLEFSFRNTPVAGINQWIITKWKDFTAEGKSQGNSPWSSSLGRILARSYAMNPLEPT